MKTLAHSITLIALAIYGVSCIGTGTITQTSGLSHAELSVIPKGAKEVIVKGTDGPSLYEKVVSVLLQRGHRIVKDDKERLYILTEGKDVGASTIQRMTIVISSDAVASIRSEWMPGQDAIAMGNAMSGLNVTPSWSIANYTTGRPAIAFAEAVAIGKAVGGPRLSFK